MQLQQRVNWNDIWAWWKDGWHAAVQSVGTIVFPPKCGGCDHALSTRPQAGLCESCIALLTENAGRRCSVCDLPSELGAPSLRQCAACMADTPAYSMVRAPYVYGGPLSAAIVRAKFNGGEHLAQGLGELLCQHTDTMAWLAARNATMLIPVPLGSQRRRQRGYNQSAIIAKAISQRSGLPVHHALRRVRNTSPQSSLVLRDRRANLIDAFLASEKSVRDQRVVLIDDVVTSGETAHCAAVALRHAGAQNVAVLAVARAV